MTREALKRLTAECVKLPITSNISGKTIVKTVTETRFRFDTTYLIFWFADDTLGIYDVQANRWMPEYDLIVSFCSDDMKEAAAYHTDLCVVLTELDLIDTEKLGKAMSEWIKYTTEKHNADLMDKITRKQKELDELKKQYNEAKKP